MNIDFRKIAEAVHKGVWSDLKLIPRIEEALRNMYKRGQESVLNSKGDEA